MTYNESTRTGARRTRSTILAAILVVSATFIGVHLYQSWASSSSSAAFPIDIRSGDHHLGGDGRGGGEPVAPQPRRLQPPGVGKQPEVHVAPTEPSRPRPEGDQRRRGAPSEADGAVPDGTTVFDDEMPAVANLDPALLGALRRAATDAANNGVEFYVTSGWRSPAYQNQLLHEAISEYGSEAAAARWVATADTSPHVSGHAVDIGHADATAWLSEHGTTYGLCQIYRNEPWHYELHPEAIEHGCPSMYADPTYDPRMQP